MNALVVYESLWGNTRAVAEAVAAGLGNGAAVASTASAATERVSQVDLLVAGAPILAFHLPTDPVRHSIESNPRDAAHHPDLSHPSMKAWLETVPAGPRFGASYETRLKRTLGSSAKSIAQSLESRGYRMLARPERFIVTGRYGPLLDGELEHARAWGEELARRLAAGRAL